MALPKKILKKKYQSGPLGQDKNPLSLSCRQFQWWPGRGLRRGFGSCRPPPALLPGGGAFLNPKGPRRQTCHDGGTGKIIGLGRGDEGKKRTAIKLAAAGKLHPGRMVIGARGWRESRGRKALRAPGELSGGAQGVGFIRCRPFSWCGHRWPCAGCPAGLFLSPTGSVFPTAPWHKVVGGR